MQYKEYTLANREREKQISVRINQQEYDMILEKMKSVGTNDKSAYMRKMLIDGYVISYDFKEVRQLLSELGRIGNNINQIARHANQNNAISQDAVEETHQLMKEIKHEVTILYNQLVKL